MLSVLSIPPAYAQTRSIQMAPVSREVIEQHVREFSDKDSERELVLRRLFVESGCKEDRLSEQWVRRKDPPNLKCTLPGKGAGVIIVAAHFDHVRAGKGVIDDWSGASLLPSLFQSLSGTERNHTFEFVGFTDEEEGLVGSKYFVKQLTREQAENIRAMINLECLGLTPTKVWVSHADRALLAHFTRVAASMKLPIAGVNVDNVGDDDADSFRGRKIPTITVHSVTAETFSILHSRRDDLPALNPDEYYDSYRLVAGYLAYLDAVLN
jgi:hypothetical protein